MIALPINKNRLSQILALALSLIVVLPVCSSTKPQETAQAAIESCQYLQNVEGFSGYGKNFDWKSLAKNSVVNKAEKIGASHIVWDRFYSIGAFNGIATAKAYKCSS